MSCGELSENCQGLRPVFQSVLRFVLYNFKKPRACQPMFGGGVSIVIINPFNLYRMKQLVFLGLIACASLFSCSHPHDPEYSGETLMMACFNRIGIKTTISRDSVIYIIPDELKGQFNTPGVRLRFDAELRANTLQPTFPDPSLDPSTIYQAKISNVVGEDD